MPPTNIAFLFKARWCGVMEATRFLLPFLTYKVASFVVICSRVILSSGNSLQIKSSFLSMNSFSLSKYQYFVRYFSMNKKYSISAIVSSIGTPLKSFTPNLSLWLLQLDTVLLQIPIHFYMTF